MAKLTSRKARKILRDKEVRGKKLTPRQRRFFGAVAGGTSRTSRTSRISRKRRGR